MKISKIVEAMGYIDDDLITASIDYKPRRIRMKWIPYAAAAACAACLCIFAVRFSNFDTNLASGTFNGGDVTAGGACSESAPPASEVSGNINNAVASGTSGDTSGSLGVNYGGGKPGDPVNSSGEKPGSSKPGDPSVSSEGKPGSGKPEDPVNSSAGEPNAYLSTRSATFSEAKEQVRFVDVKEVSGADFVGYELEYVMPAERLIALKYVYTDGYVSVLDNSGDWGGKYVISPEWDEKIESDGMVFWKSKATDPPAAIYISESDIAYFGIFKSDADLSKAIEAIKSLILLPN